jgi:DNA helicase-2/ATP-dependent DNA helicase PcrA
LSASPISLAAALFEHLLSGLTADQATAVTHGAGPQIIIAGPGSGKTKTLIARVRYLLATGRALPREIVLVTFTNNTARECRERLEREIGGEAIAGMVVCTFHALCARLLRTHASLIGRTASFTIYDERALREVIDEITHDPAREAVKVALAGRKPPPAKKIAGEISLAKNRLWSADDYARRSRHPLAQLVSAVWRALDAELALSNAVSFDDLLCLAVRLLGEHPDLQAHYRARWRWLLVDEVQDTCYAQMGLLRLLAQPAGNLTICGDLDQALYSFRGAEPRNLLSFPALFPSRREVTLAVNFRSREEIVRHAEALINRNRNRRRIEFEARRGPGGRVIAKGFENEYQESGWIAGEISRQIHAGREPEQFLVLARAGFAYKPVARALARSGIAHHVLGSTGLFEREAVKHALAYLQLIENPLDAIALRRAISHPSRQVGPVSCQAIAAHARGQQIALLEACARHAQIPGLRKRGRENLERFASQMLAIRDAHRAGAPVSNTIERVLRMAGGLERHYEWQSEHPSEQEDGDDAKAALLLLRGMRNAAQRYQQQEEGPRATLLGFVERAVGLHSDGPGIVNEGVGFSTIHGAKGTERPAVFICASEEEVSPSRHALKSTSTLAIEEERCAYYVAMTRAEDLLVTTWAASRNRRRQRRSRFLTEAGL